MVVSCASGFPAYTASTGRVPARRTHANAVGARLHRGFTAGSWVSFAVRLLPCGVCRSAFRSPPELHDRALCRAGQPVEAIAVGLGQLDAFRGEVLLKVVDPGGAGDRENDR